MNVRFPDISVQLVGRDGNAFAILAAVSKALKQGGASPEEVKEFFEEATQSDYNHLLQTACKWVNVK